MCMSRRKIRVNITVDTETLAKAKTKLSLFGGKLSTLFDAYLRDFVASMGQEHGSGQKALQQRLLELEARTQKLERAFQTREGKN